MKTTKQERIQEALSACGMAAEDCKVSADYCGYAFSKQRNEAEGRRYFSNLSENFARLKSAMASLDFAHRDP